MIIIRPNQQLGKEVRYDLIQERVIAQGLTRSDAEWIARRVNESTDPQSPTVDYVRQTFDQAVAEARAKTDLDRLTAAQVQRKKAISEQIAYKAATERGQAPIYPFGDVDAQRAHQAAVNAKLDGFTAEAGRPTSAPFEGVPGCGCVPCTIYWQQKDRARRNPIQYPGGKS